MKTTKKSAIAILVMLLLLTGCTYNADSEASQEVGDATNSQQQNENDKSMILKFTPKDVSISQNDNEVTFKNSYEPDLVEYAWYIIDDEKKETIDKIMYNKTDGTLVYTFDHDGHFRVKAFVRAKDDAENKLSKIIADVYVEDGNVTVVSTNPS